MARFAIECPYCGTVNKASTFVLAKKTIVCGSCKNEIDVKAHRMAVGKCEKCGEVAFDVAKGKCPVCKGDISTVTSAKATSLSDLKDLAKNENLPLILCPQCNCSIQPSKNAGTVICPVCDYNFDGYEEVYKCMQKEKLVAENGISVIKYEGDNETLVWKHPIEDFNLGTQLIVHESQEAIFCLNGKALDLFGPGKYSLETESLPILRKVYELPTGKQSPFHAEVYFINKTVQMGLKWGTDSRVRFIDPETNIPLDIGASGQMNLQVCDSRKLLVKLVGTTSGLSRSQILNATKRSTANIKDNTEENHLNDDWSDVLRFYFRPHIMMSVKSYLATVIREQHIDILDIDSHMESISLALREKVSKGLEEFGLFVPQFYVTNISLPEKDKTFERIRNLRSASYIGVKEAEVAADIVAARRKKILEEQTTELEKARFEAEKARIKAQGEADVLTTKGSATNELRRQKGLIEAEIMAQKGYTGLDEIQAGVQKEFAKGIGQFGANGGGSGVAADMLGLGMGVAVAGTMGSQINEVMKGFNNPVSHEVNNNQPKKTGWKCECGQEGNLNDFCPACGKKKPSVWICPNCGEEGLVTAFCGKCGTKKPAVWDCAKCGAKGNVTQFCPNCGNPKDAMSAQPVFDTWNCDCGKTGLSSAFCPGCGNKRKDG